MISLGLSVADQIYFENLLRRPHWRSTKVRVLDLDHRYLGDISDRLYTGQVNIDITAEVTRSLSADFIDPDYQLGFDSANPVQGTVFLNRMLQASYVYEPPDRSVSFEVPIFTGPINKPQRAGGLVRVEAQGKDALAAQTLRSSKTYSTRWRKSQIILDLLQYTGESRFRFDRALAMNTKTLTLNRTHKPVVVAKSVANSMGLKLFWDGTGTAVLRKVSTRPVYVFDGGVVLSEPEPGYDLESLVNAVLVIGGKGTRPLWRIAPANHALSPSNLGRGNPKKGRYFTQEISDTSLNTRTKQIRAGNAALASGLLQSVDLAFSSAVVPHLEEYDTYTYRSPDFSTNATVRTLALPLTADGTMSVGSLRRVTPVRHAFRKK